MRGWLTRLRCRLGWHMVRPPTRDGRIVCAHCGKVTITMLELRDVLGLRRERAVNKRRSF